MLRNPFSSCCSTGCDRIAGEKYIECLQLQIDAGLPYALLKESGDKSDVLARFVVECLFTDNGDPIHVDWMRFMHKFGDYVEEAARRQKPI